MPSAVACWEQLAERGVSWEPSLTGFEATPKPPSRPSGAEAVKPAQTTAASEAAPSPVPAGPPGTASAETADQPRWMAPTLAAVERLLALRPNWNSYGAPQVDRTALKSAFQLLYWAASVSTPPPAVVPTGAGGVQLEWHEHGLDIEVYIEPSEVTATLFVQDHHKGTEMETRVFADVTALSKILQHLTGRAAGESEAR